MSNPYHIKETVKLIPVTRQKQKIHFQIRHPENAISVIGIAVTCDLIQENWSPDQILNPKGDTAGLIAISIPCKGDLVYGDEVRVDSNDYSDIMEKTVYGLFMTIAESGPRDFYFKTNYKIDKAFLEGFYRDEYSPEIYDKSGLKKRLLYRIRVYLRYLMREQEPKQAES